MSERCFTLHGQAGWVDVRVLNAATQADGIRIAERLTGCRVSHGRGAAQPDFDPNYTVDAATGDVTQHHSRVAQPQVVVGPPDVMRAIAQALRPPKSKR